MTTPGTTDPEAFRIRGDQVSRVEALSDAVFALAMTLLIVSVQVPDTYDKLMNDVRGFPAFAVCFSILIWFWHAHYVFCRRYALQDTTTIVLNSVLLFVVLVYVYPMRFLFNLFISGILGLGGGSMPIDQARRLFELYGTGFAAIWAVFALMHLHAYRRREDLGLDPMERLITRGQVGGSCSRVAIGLASVLFARFASDQWVGLCGWVYFLMSVTETAHGTMMGWRARQLAAELNRSGGPPSGTAHPPRG